MKTSAPPSDRAADTPLPGGTARRLMRSGSILASHSTKAAHHESQKAVTAGCQNLAGKLRHSASFSPRLYTRRLTSVSRLPIRAPMPKAAPKETPAKRAAPASSSG